ncbi:MAG: hypothetical protein HC772_20390 [Leptolyngbyaceae cyanobacterium CRU_2_3]|nr:hypothetical protein [Leptolyngbyaceae cyanobacterium CRU_2_3]
MQFDDVICLHVFDEYSRLDNDVEEEREPHVVALHKKSVLIAWLKESTYLFHLSTKDAPLHYSVLTANEYYHVITRIEPSISEEHSL